MVAVFLPLLLGLTAWGCGFGAWVSRRPALLPLSWFFCSWSLLLPLWQVCRWVAKGDVAAILDVSAGYFVAALTLLGVNTLLSFLLLIRKPGV